jgi:hypothetical protein
MRTFGIALQDIGRNKHSEEFIKKFKDLEHAETFAYNEVRKHLYSTNSVNLEYSDNEKRYVVFAGFHTVGTVKIWEITK